MFGGAYDLPKSRESVYRKIVGRRSKCQHQRSGVGDTGYCHPQGIIGGIPLPGGLICESIDFGTGLASYPWQYRIGQSLGTPKTFLPEQGAHMCLGVPGKVLHIEKDESLNLYLGKVAFGGITKDVNLSYTPEVQVGDYVVVHVGFAISRLNEEEAQQVFHYLKQLGELQQLEIPKEGS